MEIEPLEIEPLREIRNIRRDISTQCGNDPEKVFDYYQMRQEQLIAAGTFTIISEPLAGATERRTTEQPRKSEPK